MGHSTLTAASNAADRLLLGFVVSATTFGFYHLGRQLLDIMQNFLNTIHTQMGLQVFTHMLQSPETFRKNYYKYRLFFDIPACIGAGILYMVTSTIVAILFDDRYSDVAAIMQIMVFSLVITGPVTLRDAYSAERNFQAMTMLSLLSTIVLWAGLFLTVLIFDSFTAALWVIALYRVPEVVALWVGAAKRGWLVYWREALLPVFVVTGMALGYFLNNLLLLVVRWIES